MILRRRSFFALAVATAAWLLVIWWLQGLAQRWYSPTWITPAGATTSEASLPPAALPETSP